MADVSPAGPAPPTDPVFASAIVGREGYPPPDGPRRSPPDGDVSEDDDPGRAA